MAEKEIIPVYTYLGLSKEDSARWLANMRAGVKMRTTKPYKITKRDGGAVLAAKKDRQKEFLAEREREIQEKLKQHQKYRTLGKVTFEVGKPQALNELTDDDEKPVYLETSQVFKLNSLVFDGIFSRKPPLSEKELKTLQNYKPKKKER